MLVSFAHNLIFLKTRKTAGTSVEMFLQQAIGLPGGVPSETTPAIVSDKGIVGRRMRVAENQTPEDAKWFNHIPTTRLRKHLGEDLWTNYLKVATIRNPFDRMISAFFWKRGAKKQFSTEIDVLRSDLEDFVLNAGYSDDREILFDKGQFAPDLCIRYEHLEGDLAALCAERKIDTTGCDLPRAKRRKTLRRGHTLADFYTPRAKSAVQSQYDWMFERFGYAPDPATSDTPTATTDISAATMHPHSSTQAQG